MIETNWATVSRACDFFIFSFPKRFCSGPPGNKMFFFLEEEQDVFLVRTILFQSRIVHFLSQTNWAVKINFEL